METRSSAEANGITLAHSSTRVASKFFLWESTSTTCLRRHPVARLTVSRYSSTFTLHLPFCISAITLGLHYTSRIQSSIASTLVTPLRPRTRAREIGLPCGIL